MELSIIIPAYKPFLLHKVLTNVSEQSCKKFNVYIFNDNSPYDLDSIIIPFIELNDNFSYFKFETNLGSEDLVAHWHRCIEKINSCSYIWFLPDDDYPDLNCVRNFYKSLNKYPNNNLFRFSTIIHYQSTGKSTINNFPLFQSSLDFATKKIGLQQMSSLGEYIIRLEKFKEIGGFVKFSLAWFSDDATWVSVSKDSKIIRIENSKVHINNDVSNISSDTSDKSLPKIQATFEYLQFLKKNGYLQKILKNNTIDITKFVYYQIVPFKNQMSINLMIQIIIRYILILKSHKLLLFLRKMRFIYISGDKK